MLIGNVWNNVRNFVFVFPRCYCFALTVLHSKVDDVIQ